MWPDVGLHVFVGETGWVWGEGEGEEVGDWVGVEGVWGGGREPQLGSWRSRGGEFELCVGSARLSVAPTQSAAIIICPPPTPPAPSWNIASQRSRDQ